MEVKSINGANNYQSNNIKKNNIYDKSFEDKLQAAYDKKDDEKLKSVCKEFESIFLNMMMKQMRATVQKSDLIPSSMGTEVFEGMLDEKLMEEASKGRGFGLGDSLYNQMKMQISQKYTPESVTDALTKKK